MTIRHPRRPDSKIPELCTLVKQLALEKGPGAKLPRANELCQMYATSIATLNEVLAILEEQHVISRRQGSGIYVSSRIHRKSICVLFYSRLFSSDVLSPFWGIFQARFLEEMERRMKNSNEYYSLHFVMQPTETDIQATHNKVSLPEDVISMILSGKVHAIMAVGLENQTYQWLQSLNIPSVTYAGLGTCTVNFNSIEGLRLAVASLVEHGCRSIGLWATTSINEKADNNPYIHQFGNILSEFGLALQPELVRTGIPVSAVPQDKLAGTYPEQGYQIALDVFGNSEQPKPDGLFIVDDMMTHGALAALRLLNIDIKHDLKIATHSNAGSPIFFGETAYLDRIQYDAMKIVQNMFQLIRDLALGIIPEKTELLLNPELLKATH